MRRKLDQGCYRRVPSTPDEGDWRDAIFEDVISIDADNGLGRHTNRSRSRERTQGNDTFHGRTLKRLPR